MAQLQRRPVIYLCGDSLTQQGGEIAGEGWCLLLQQAYLRSADVVNRGLSGYNTKWFIQHALPVVREELRSAFSPALITLWLGANDAALIEGPAKNQHVPLRDYQQNLVMILHEFRMLAPQAEILLITPPVVDDEARRRIQVDERGAQLADPLDRTNEQATVYAAACAQVASQVDNVTLLDLHAFFMETYPENEQRTQLLRDGLHFSMKGNHIVYKHIKQQIQTLMRSSTATRSLETWQLPDWKELAL